VRERPILFNGDMVRAILDGRKTQTRRPADVDRLRIQLPRAVRSDVPFLLDATPLVAPPGVHRARINPQGAVFVPFKGGETLGIKPGEYQWVSPFGAVGDRLYVRESAYIAPPDFAGPRDGNVVDGEGRRRVVSWAASADGEERRCAEDYAVKLTPSIHMPRWAARLVLRVTAVRLERLQAITEEDARQEGVRYDAPYWLGGPHRIKGTPKCHADARTAFAELWTGIYGVKGADWDVNPWVWAVGFERMEVAT
jgi:hypothetical protein